MNYKYHFFNDYSEGAHPEVLKILGDTNLEQEIGYGDDTLTTKAKELIKKAIGNSEADVHLVSAGTQANFIVLATILKPYESVIAPSTGHINIHEAGAVEATGHKINSVETTNSKIAPGQIQKVLDSHHDEHLVKPRAVCIAQPTELGTVYSKKELEDISKFCRERSLYLFIDGARLGISLTSSANDLSLKDIASLSDAFYIGGTKNGALLGEAIVLINENFKENFRHMIKQQGALLAKGRVLGAQFVGLFKDDLYFKLATHANEMATKLSSGIKELGFSFLADSPTNQLFPILSNSLIAKLKKMYGFYIWTKVDPEHSAIRLVTSWATTEKAINDFLDDLGQLSKE